jgi:hypothetical protein
MTCTPHWIVEQAKHFFTTQYFMTTYEQYSNNKNEPHVQLQTTQNGNKLLIQHKFPLFKFLFENCNLDSKVNGMTLHEC